MEFFKKLFKFNNTLFQQENMSNSTIFMRLHCKILKLKDDNLSSSDEKKKLGI